jgi:hypothetical protein
LPDILAGVYDDPLANAEEDVVQDQANMSLATRLGKNLLNPMNTLRKLQRAIFRKKSNKLSLSSDSVKFTAQKELAIKIDIKIESTEETIEIFDKSKNQLLSH